MLTILAATTAAQVIQGVRGQMAANDKGQQADRQLGRLQALEDRYATVENELRGAMEGQKWGNVDLDPMRMMELKDALAALAPEAVKFDQAGNALSIDFERGAESLRRASEQLRGGKVETTNTRILASFDNDEVRKAAEQRQKLLSQRMTTSRFNTPRQIEINAGLAETAGVFDRHFFQPMTALMTQAGRNQVGIGGYLPTVQRVAKTTGQAYPDLLGRYLKTYLESGSGNTIYDLQRVLKLRGTTSEQFATSGLAQFEKGGPIIHMGTGERVTPEAAGGRQIEFWKEFAGVITLSAKKVSEFVGEYEKAVRELIKSNQDILASQKSVATAILATRNPEGKAPQVSSVGVEALGRQITAMDEIRRRDFNLLSMPSDTGDNSDIASQLRQMTGEVIRAVKSGRTGGLRGLSEGAAQFDATLSRVTNRAEQYVDTLLKERKGLYNPLMAVEDMPQGAAQEFLTKSLNDPNLMSRVMSAIATSSERLKAGDRMGASRSAEEARNLVAGSIRDQSEEARRTMTEGLRDLLGRSIDMAREGADAGQPLRLPAPLGHGPERSAVHGPAGDRPRGCRHGTYAR